MTRTDTDDKCNISVIDSNGSNTRLTGFWLLSARFEYTAQPERHWHQDR
jgi:hypothetical protein